MSYVPRLIRIRYRLFGRHECSIYDGNWFTIDEAIADVIDKMPEAKIMGFDQID